MVSDHDPHIRVSPPFEPAITLFPLRLPTHALSGGGQVAITRHVNATGGP
ncbi:MAG: hypothetical protein WBQ25_07435 [Nitrososphaeraceae archaeon]